MSEGKHGLYAKIEKLDNQVFLHLKAVGKLTHEDYQKFTPSLESVLADTPSPRIRVLIDATEMEGWELRAAWDDLKIDLKHGREFDRIAIYGNKSWQKMIAKIGAWFTSGEVKYFEHYNDALAWAKE
jgi:stage II sporulation SpoAA-like protein